MLHGAITRRKGTHDRFDRGSREIKDKEELHRGLVHRYSPEELEVDGMNYMWVYQTSGYKCKNSIQQVIRGRV